MNRNDIIDLLTVIAAGDRRTIGTADIDFWHTIVADVPKDLALEAVKRHFRERPGVWLEPGHIVQGARTIHNERLQRESDEMREARQAALDARLAEVIVEVADTTAIPDKFDPAKFKRREPNPLTVSCGYCRAGIGNRCTSGGLTMQAFHDRRIQLAEQFTQQREAK